MKTDTVDTNLLNYLGKSPEMKLLDFLIENRRTSWNITEIEQQGGIARSTLKAVIPKLLGLGLIRIDRAIGRSNLYLLNGENPVVGSIVRLSKQIDDIESTKRAVLGRVPAARKARMVGT